MGVLPIITLMFAEILAAAVGIGAFLYLMRAPVRPKRRLPAALFAASFLLISLSGLALFLGQFFQIYSISIFSNKFLFFPLFFFPISSALVIMAAFRVYGFRWRLILDAVAILIGLAGFAVAWTLPKNTLVISGLSFPDATLRSIALIFLPSLVLGSILIFSANFAVAKDQQTRADYFMRRAGIYAVAFYLMMTLAVYTAVSWVVLLSIFIVPIHAAYLYFAAASKVNADRSLEDRPFHIIDRRLKAKAVVMNVALFSLLMLLIMVVMAGYFVEMLDQARSSSRKRDLTYITRSYASYSIALLEETIRLASVPSLQAPSGEKDLIDLDLAIQAPLRGRMRIFRVIDKTGLVIYSSYSDDEIGNNMGSSVVVQKALKGNHVAASELDEGVKRWVIRAAAPIKSADGNTGLVLLGTDISDAFDFSDYGEISASGYGFFSVRGEVIYSVGDGVDGITRLIFEKTMRGNSVFSGETDGGLHYSVQRVTATDGTPDGFFYIFTDRSVLEREIARVLIVITAVMLLSISIIAALLMFSLSFILNPIRKLAVAAGRLEEGQYDIEIPTDSTDEVGALARAMASMSKTIGERTRNLEAALRTQRDFMGHTAMEMRTPLNIFRWTLELMRFGDLGRLNKDQMELMEQMNQTNQRLLDMVENLRVASRLDEKRLVLSRDGVAVEDVIEEVAGELSVKMRERGLALHWNRPDIPLPAVFADRQRLYQIMLNLMSNAVKYTRKNGHIEAAIDEVDSSGPVRNIRGRYIKTTIEDSGMGISKNEQGRVFSRFFRSKDVLKTEIEGTGLGLYIAKQLVELHGGEIWFESTEGVGTAFHFTIPVKNKYDGAERGAMNL